ncbi:MAG TPA: choice-of-anchor J domain-containing protein [Chitinophagales bacterium]|nr:choice-of-anchor J domain-containing protein [Chitinophagales bacterium]
MKRKLLQLAFATIAATMFSLNVSGQLSGYYQEDFEGTFPPSGWQTVDVLDPTAVWMQSTDIAYSGTHSTFLQWSDYYAPGEDWLILPQFTVGASDSLSFWMALHDAGYAPDSTWILVSTTDFNISSFTSVVGTLSEGDNYPSAADTFEYYSFSLLAFAGQDIYVAIKNRNSFGDGIYFDLVTLGSIPSIDAAATTIDVPDAVSTTYSNIPQATVKNNGLTNQTFSVTMNITGGYSSTKTVTNLAGGSSQQIDFDPWFPTSAGDYTVSVQTQLVGDVVPSNDTLSKVVTAYDPLSGYYQQDFEGSFPPTRWETVDVSDPLDSWQQINVLPHSGSYSTYLSYSPSYSPGEDWLILPQFTVAATDSFSFWFAIQFSGYSPDSTYIMVSTTDTYLSSFTNTLGALSEGSNYPDTTLTYQYYSFPLDAYAGQNIYVAFKNRNIDGDGIFVDLVTIGSLLDFDAKAQSIDLPDVVSTVTPIIPKATVKNNSPTVQSFTVTMTATGGYSSTKNVTNLGAGAQQQVDFDSWQPLDSGQVTVNIQTQLAGDQNLANDTLSKVIQAYPPLSLYYTESFEGSFPPPAWQVRDVLDQPITWQQSGGLPYSGSFSAFLNQSIFSQGEDWLILPQFHVAATDSFSFALGIDDNANEPDSTYIMVSTTDTYLSSFTNILPPVLSEGDNYPALYLEYDFYKYSLSDYAGQYIYVAFKNRNIHGDGIYIDTVSIGTPIGVGIDENAASHFDLSSYPNPFSADQSGSTSIYFSLDHSSAVRISIVDVLGKEVEELCNKTLPAGPQQIVWKAAGYAAGVYFCKVSVNGNVSTEKLVKLN